jgi:hypothetical protein
METSLSRTYYRALDRVIARLADRKGEWNNIAEQSGIPRSTIKHIAHGRIKQPDVTVLETLDRLLVKRNGKQKH